MKKIAVLMVVFILAAVFSLAVSAEVISPRYIPCDTLGCPGQYIMSEYQKRVTEPVICSKYPTTKYDYRYCVVEISEISCRECNYYDMDSVQLTGWTVVCDH